MKPFTINRNSWHYRLNRDFLNEDGFSERSMELNWEPRHRDFCSYWRATVGRVIAFNLAVAALFLLIVGFAHLVVYYPIDLLIAVAVIIGIFAVIVMIALAEEAVKGRKKNQPEGLISQRLRAYKSRVCPIVEYEE